MTPCSLLPRLCPIVIGKYLHNTRSKIESLVNKYGRKFEIFMFQSNLRLFFFMCNDTCYKFELTHVSVPLNDVWDSVLLNTDFEIIMFTSGTPDYVCVL